LKLFLLGLLSFSSLTVFGNVDLKDLKIVLYSDLTSQESEQFCKKRSDVDPEICLMTKSKAVEYCKTQGMKLPSVRDFAEMMVDYGAYITQVPCENGRTCQHINPVNEDEFYYDKGDAEIGTILPKWWFHTSSLRELGANFKFGSHTGFMGSSSVKHPGNVVCI
jgi:hypothetical protein